MLDRKSLLKPRLLPIAVSLLTIVTIIMSMNGSGFNIASNMFDNEWLLIDKEKVQKKVITANLSKGKKVIIMGGSQIMVGFPKDTDLNNKYASIYNNQNVDFKEIGYSRQTAAESLLLLTNFDIDQDTIVLSHVSPNRLHEIGNTECENIKIPAVHTIEYDSLRNRPFSINCFVNKLKKRGLILMKSAQADISKMFGRGFQERAKIKPTQYELDYLKDSIAFRKEMIRNVISKSDQILDKYDRWISNYQPTIPVRNFYKMAENYVESKGGRFYLIEMPWSEHFLVNNPAFLPENYLDDSVVSSWLQNTSHPEKYFSNSMLTENYYNDVRSTGIKFVSFREHIYEDIDFYDSMHFTKYGREKFLPRFFEWINQEFENTDTD
ncbi:hypothetical protein [Curvivirga aplysinae]|uniref:hypothetical protein n=1 Tax=Curvivirga aplysinae TaxID=2529852 RepID=UPI0012BC4644|nr:hypothetical protein [Curvivirga aplysinae]MTI10394.1 hypothetical protein [Curvivirga aplysinae]